MEASGSEPLDYEEERAERRGLEQRAATLIAAMLVLIGLVASGHRDLVAAGPTARDCLIATVVLMAIAIGLLAIALTLRSVNMRSSLDRATQVMKSNVRVLWWIRVGTFCLAVAVALTTIALISAFSSPAKPPLGTKANPLEVHAPD